MERWRTPSLSWVVDCCRSRCSHDDDDQFQDSVISSISLDVNMEHLIAESCSVLSSAFSSLLSKRLRELRVRKTKRAKKRWWVRKWILERNNSVERELSNEHPEDFKNLLSMSEEQFDFLLKRVSPHISKSDTNMRQALSTKIKLQVTLRYLATGDSFKTMEYLFRVPKSTISHFVPETCRAITKELEEFMKVPSTEEEWKNVEYGFRDRWNFPGCMGSIDGKHIKIRPAHSGSDSKNSKNSFSSVLLAVADSDYNFLHVEVGSKGRGSDGGIFRNSSLFTALETNNLNKPDDFVIVGDDAFPLKTYLMKPYSRRNMTTEEKIYNYRLSRARRVIENTFGVLVSKFRIFERPISLKPESVDDVVLACCSLHNWLRKTNPTYISSGLIDYEDENHSIVPGFWRKNPTVGLQDLPRSMSRNPTRQAQQIRDKYRDFFNNEGAVPWQYRLANVTPPE